MPKTLKAMNSWGNHFFHKFPNPFEKIIVLNKKCDLLIKIMISLWFRAPKTSEFHWFYKGWATSAIPLISYNGNSFFDARCDLSFYQNQSCDFRFFTFHAAAAHGRPQIAKSLAFCKGWAVVRSLHFVEMQKNGKVAKKSLSDKKSSNES